MEKTIIALLAFFVATAYNKPVPDGPYKISMKIKNHDPVYTHPCFILKMKVQNSKRILGLGTCCDQDQWTDFRTVKGAGGTTTKLKIMSSDLNYVLTDKLEFVNATYASSLSPNKVYFKTGRSTFPDIDTISLQTMSSPFKYLSVDYPKRKVTLVDQISDTTSFRLESKSVPNSVCNLMLNSKPTMSPNYCQLIAKPNCG